MERYGQDSELIELDGVTLRYSDQGSGPAIILLHGAFGNLNYWDDWADAMVGTNRVVRFDVPPEGVSGPDPKGYSHDRAAELIGLLAGELGIEKFALSGISRGGTASVLYASRHPERVTHLILANTPLLNAKPQAVQIPDSFKRQEMISSKLLSNYKQTAYWRGFFDINSVVPSRIGPKWIDLYKDMNNRQGGASDLDALRAMGADRDEDRNIAAAKAITMPTMFLTTQSIALPPSEQNRVIALFINTPVTIVPIDTGHFPAIELGDEAGKIAQQFMATPDNSSQDPAAIEN